VPVYGKAFSVFFGTEHLADVVGEADGHVEQRAGAGCTKVGHGGLEEVAGAVHLVQVEVGPAFVRPLEGEVRVEVAVRLLGVGYLGYGGVHHPLQVGVGVGGERPGGCFEPLVHVRVVEVEAPERSVYLARGAAEVVQAARLLEVPVLRGECLLAVDAPPRLPEAVGEPHGGQRQGPQTGVTAA
jgi:hypothetical protein